MYARTPSPTALYTGTIAVPRDPAARAAFQAAPGYQAALDNAATVAATQRAERAGLDSDAVPSLVEYFRNVGRFPDLSLLQGGGGAPGGGSAGFAGPGAAVATPGGFGVSSNALLLLGGAVVVGAFLLMRGGKR